MARSDALPLTEILQILHRVFAGESQYAVKHRRHVAGIEEETVAGEPLRVLRVVFEKRRVQHIDEIGCPERAAGMA